ncbi:alpha-E domain-containing protein [Limibaculum sp. M0105]|uniref:Alpha-E domain-containing protein n=1 Tax=Thermohalobaculum xanthum TaxID=2753746 RepID=A0A8J7SDW8_9RHOB|nr:alpha-E domain-containing protein [Thermohalobaculum xanthum]MBK0399106.1 alpha-E domain-containing protein [Thermohalobaculum xanthum]
MLSRTAESLYWMGRYVERAECTARLIEMGHRMAMLPGSYSDEEWRSVASASGSAELFEDEPSITDATILRTLMLDPDNPSSIRSCLRQARANGRAVRNALTRDMWETLNEGWRRLDEVDVGSAQRDLPSLLEWIKGRAIMFRGAVSTSMLREDRFDFVLLGSHVERADMMLRLLDVKYYVLLPETEVVGGGRDYHQWTSLLHATSALRAYHHVYRGDYSPWKIADFMILNRAFPRSVAFCYDQIGNCLDRLARGYGGRHDCHGTACEMIARLDDVEMGEIFQHGLHDFITATITATRRLNGEIYRAYHF